MFALLMVFQLWAAEEPQNLLHSYPSEVLRNEIVDFSPAVGHHFSPDAPEKCGSGNLVNRSPRSIRCQFTQSGLTEATLNVCDDKQTFCKALQVKVDVSAKMTADINGLIKNESLNRDLKRTLVPGFVEIAPADATKEALTRGQPVFVMISTDWCPACNEAKEYLLSSQAFQKAAQNWFKVYVDGDSLGASDWDHIVPYRYYPSFVLLNSKMQEVARFTGEIRQSDFEAWAKETNIWITDPIEKLKERVVARKKGSWKQKIKDLWNGVNAAEALTQEERLLDWALARNEKDLLKVLLPTNQFPKLEAQILTYEVAELEAKEKEEGKDLKAQKIQIYEKLLQHNLKGEHWGETLQNLCGVDLEACKPHLAKVQERLDYVRNQGGLTEAEKASQLGDEYYYITEVYQTVGDKKAEADFAVKCVEHYESMKRKSFLKISRAGQQGMVACLELSGQFQKEEALLESLIKAYPNEATFPWRMARALRKDKKPEQALPWIAKAESLAYGYNWFSIQILKADVYLDLKRAQDAKKVVGEALSQVRLESPSDTRNQSLVARLRTIQDKTENVVQK